MAKRLIANIGAGVKVHSVSEFGHRTFYIVTVVGLPDADYYADDRMDAMQTANVMRNNVSNAMNAAFKGE